MKLCHETSQLVSWIYSKLERFSHYKCIKFVLFLRLGPTLELETEQDFRPASYYFFSMGIHKILLLYKNCPGKIIHNYDIKSGFKYRVQ